MSKKKCKTEIEKKEADKGKVFKCDKCGNKSNQSNRLCKPIKK